MRTQNEIVKAYILREEKSNRVQRQKDDGTPEGKKGSWEELSREARERWKPDKWEQSKQGSRKSVKKGCEKEREGQQDRNAQELAEEEGSDGEKHRKGRGEGEGDWETE